MALVYLSIGKQMQANVRANLAFTAIGVFLFVGALMASYAATTLLWPGTPLDRLWELNPKAYTQLVPLAPMVGLLFLLLCACLVTAGLGWFRRRLWGWRLTVAIIAIQLMGDAFHCLQGDFLGGGVGVIIAGGLLLYLFRPAIRRIFL